MPEEFEKDEAPAVFFTDKRRIKSVDDTCDDADEADLDRVPSIVTKLEEESKERDDRLKEYIAAHKEKMAEMDAIRKRIEEDAGNAALNRFGELIADLLPVVDDIDRALAMAQNDNPDDPLIPGVKIMRQGLIKALKTRGLEEIDCMNETFDPEVAQAVGMVNVEDSEQDNVVVEQMASGYMFNGRVLRHAMVRVGEKV